jgi:hypothetical protein
MEHKQYKRSKAHLTTLNLNNFKMIEAMGFKKNIASRSRWHCLHTKFHEDLPSGPEVISGG